MRQRDATRRCKNPPRRGWHTQTARAPMRRHGRRLTSAHPMHRNHRDQHNRASPSATGELAITTMDAHKLLALTTALSAVWQRSAWRQLAASTNRGTSSLIALKGGPVRGSESSRPPTRPRVDWRLTTAGRTQDRKTTYPRTCTNTRTRTRGLTKEAQTIVLHCHISA